MLESGTWNIASIACLAVRSREVLGLWYLRSLSVQVNAFRLSHHVASHRGDSLVLWWLTELVAVLRSWARQPNVFVSHDVFADLYNTVLSEVSRRTVRLGNSSVGVQFTCILTGKDGRLLRPASEAAGGAFCVGGTQKQFNTKLISC